MLNLSNAKKAFDEFVEEIRYEWQHSEVAVLPAYHESLALRMIQNICAILREDSRHSLGWSRWSDRVFYQGDDGIVRSLSTLWGSKTTRHCHLVYWAGVVGRPGPDAFGAAQGARWREGRISR